MTTTIKFAMTALIVLASTTTFASYKTDEKFAKLIKDYKINPVNKQAYCYTDGKGILRGKNLDARVNLASVTKLLTSYWAIEKRGVNYTHDTKLFIKGKKLHIKGSYDPFMNNEKMMFLISQLNSLGYTHFDKITYDKKIQLNPTAEKFYSELTEVTRAGNAANLRMYFNTASWSASFKAEYDRLASMAKSGRFQKSVKFSVDTVEFSNENPLGANAKVLTLTSPKLYQYLKEINVKSNNYAAHTIFQNLGGPVNFQNFLANRYSLTTDKIKIYGGSGLPTFDNANKRYDNYATCNIVTDLINELKKSAEKQSKKISDIVAVPGNDAGTFRNRLNSDDIKNTLLAKTGTLKHTSTLAGAMNTQKGFSFFGVFNQSEKNQSLNIPNAKEVQNQMVKSIMDEMGGSKVFGYKVAGFHAYDSYEKVKSFDSFNNEEDEDASEFSSIDGNLEESVEGSLVDSDTGNFEESIDGNLEESIAESLE